MIIVTANYGSADVQAARRAGADDFLVKSFLPAALLDMAKAMLSWSGRQPQLTSLPRGPSGEWCGRDLGAKRCGSLVVGRLVIPVVIPPAVTRSNLW